MIGLGNTIRIVRRSVSAVIEKSGWAQSSRKVRDSKSVSLGGLILAFGSAVAVAQAPDPEDLLFEMSRTIEELQAFVVTGEMSIDARLHGGLMVQHTSAVTLKVLRPGSLRLIHMSADDEKEIYFNDGTLSVITQPQNYYAQTEIPAEIAAAAEFAVDELGIDAPLLDLVMKDVLLSITESSSQLEYLGESLLQDDRYHQIAIRGTEVDIQIWVSSDGTPLPGKLVITSKWEGGSPRSVGFLNWDIEPEIPTGSLQFVPPDGSVRIPILLEMRDRRVNRCE